MLVSRSSPVSRSFAIVDDESVARDAVILVIVVVAREEAPVTVRDPLEVRDDVAVIVPPVIEPEVSVVKNEVTPWMIDAMRPVVVVVAVTFRLVADSDEAVVVAR